MQWGTQKDNAARPEFMLREREQVGALTARRGASTLRMPILTFSSA